MAQSGVAQSASVKAFVDEWVAALLKGDVDTLGRITTDRAISIGPLGFVLNRDQWLGGFKTGELAYQSLQWEELSIIEYDDTAIVVGHDKHSVKYKNVVTDHNVRGQLVLVKVDGAWKLASQQYSPIHDPGNQLR